MENRLNENKKEFLLLCEDIKRPGISELLKWLETSDFFTAPASAKTLRLLCGNSDMQNVPLETIYIIALFHDLCKVNFYKKSKRNVKTDAGWVEKDYWEVEEKFPCGEHADKSIILLQQYIKLLPEEIMAIRAHMGGFDTSVKGGSFMIGKIFEKSNLAVLLHCADLMATYICEGKE